VPLQQFIKVGREVRNQHKEVVRTLEPPPTWDKVCAASLVTSSLRSASTRRWCTALEPSPIWDKVCLVLKVCMGLKVLTSSAVISVGSVLHCTNLCGRQVRKDPEEVDMCVHWIFPTLKGITETADALLPLACL